MNQETNFSFYILVGLIAVALNLALIMGAGKFYSFLTQKTPTPSSSSMVPTLVNVDVSNFSKFRFINSIPKNPREKARRQELIERLECVESEIARLENMPNKRILLDSMLGRISYLKHKHASKQYIYNIKH